MALNVGIDPGAYTGIAVWCRGKLIETMTVSMPRKTKRATKKHAAVVLSDSDRLLALEQHLDAVLVRLYDSQDGPIDTAVIETFGNHNSRFGAGDMILCAQARAVAVLVANRYSRRVVDVCKYGAPKGEADMLAKVYGKDETNSTPHERDAIHLSMLAGFHEVKQR